MPQSIADVLQQTGQIPQVPAGALQPPGGVPQSPVGSPPVPSPPDMRGYFSSLLDQETKKTQLMEKVGSEASEDIKANQKKREAIEPPKPPELTPAPKPQDSNPFQTFGSAAGWLAVFGSMLTRAPLTSALNASAGAMNAAKRNNAAEFQQKMDEWKANTENALKLHQFSMDTYKEDMEKLKDGDESVKSNVEVLARSLDDKGMIAAMQAGSEEGLRYYEAQLKMGQQMATSADRGFQIGLATKDIMQHPEWTPTQQAQRMAAATDPSVMNTEIRTEAAKDKEKTAQDAKTEKANVGYDSALEQLDDIKKKVIAGGGIGVTGLAGFGQRIGETLATVVPGVGGEVPTPASDLQSQMETLKLQLPKLLTGTSKSASDERAKVDTILRGLGPGDTRDKTLHSIQQLIDIIKQRKGERKSEKDETSDSLSSMSDEELKQQLGLQ
jgi:hypothetical protein